MDTISNEQAATAFMYLSLALAVVSLVLWYKLHSFTKSTSLLLESKERDAKTTERSLLEQISICNEEKEHEVMLAANKMERAIKEKSNELTSERDKYEKEINECKSALVLTQLKAKEDALIFAEVITDYTRQKDAGDYIPLPVLLDELEDEFGFSNPGKAFKKAQRDSKKIFESGGAAICDSSDARFKARATEFLSSLFNIRVGIIFDKLTHENCSELLGEIRKVYTEMNANAKALISTKITKEYYDARVSELKAKSAVISLKKISRDEQRALAEQKRDEEKARREIEKARRDAAREQEMLKKAMEQARVGMKAASAEERAKFESQLMEMQEKLRIAEEKGERAKSMAELTKRGHVYIISNVGSFGEEVIKIGMTRRLHPEDRVSELGSASVPFPFDIHAMIETDDAPSLELALHQEFNDQRVNKVNSRKEFFKVGVRDIKAFLDKKDLLGDSYFTLKAEASEYRDSLVIESMPKNERNQQMARISKAEEESARDGDIEIE